MQLKSENQNMPKRLPGSVYSLQYNVTRSTSQGRQGQCQGRELCKYNYKQQLLGIAQAYKIYVSVTEAKARLSSVINVEMLYQSIHMPVISSYTHDLLAKFEETVQFHGGSHVSNCAPFSKIYNTFMFSFLTL